MQDYDDAGNFAWRAPGLALPSTASCDTAQVGATSKISYAYDKLNRLTTTTFGDSSPTITRTYTPDGLPFTITSNGAVWTNTYNKRRLNEQESLAYGGVTYNFDRKYDVYGSLLLVKYPLDTTWIGYYPNAQGEPQQLGTYATAITYHPNGAIASFKYGNGILHTMTPNLRGLPQVSEDAGILKDTYAYDESANVVSITDGHEGGLTSRSMDYDNLDRLLHVASPKLWGDAWYTYDSQDNITSSQLTAGGTARKLTHTIDAVTNRLTGILNSGGTGYNLSFVYDDWGNVKQRGTQGFVFDLGNRLKSAPGKGTYAYDGLGHRVSVVGTDGVNRIHVYSQEGQLLFVKPSNASVGTKYFHLHKHVIAEVTGSTVQYDHTDGLGSQVALTDAGGRLISRTRYEPYGATAAGTTPVIGFTGHMNAPELGLVYMQQRYYDPVAGRFLSIDPVATDANSGTSFNRYWYGNNGPYKFIDPDGRDPEFMCYGTKERSDASNSVIQAVPQQEVSQGWHGEQAANLNSALQIALPAGGLGKAVVTGILGGIGRGGLAVGVAVGVTKNISKADAVIAETLAGTGNMTSQHILKADELMVAGEKFLGQGYKEIGKPGSGVFRSADGARQFRIDNNSLSGNHAPGVPHGHLETYVPGAVKPSTNNHIPFVD